ncbi:MAG TPA: NADH-quinone oxidoreductase subunit L [Blastocatellia bacterium]|nr:NADH-quinone oxidoreductase subunit L [Blastocatellia bacterium]
MLAAIILAPLAGAAFLGLLGKRLGERAIGFIACSAVGVAAVLSFYVVFGKLLSLPEEQRRIFEHLFTWINVGSFRADASLLLDPLSGIYILFVTFVGFWIHVFAIGYMRGDEGYRRFFAYLNLFMFSMLVLVLADNFLLMFVGWEGVGLCSYLLIGHYYTKDFANDAAKKAFVVNRIGDFGFALGVMLLFWKAGTVFYFTDSSRGIEGAFDWAIRQSADPLTASAIFAGGLTTIAVLLFVGATGKSAQIPLYVWLPDAMAGPTPVSALIHAATMVTAGVYMVSRASAIYIQAPAAMLIVAIIGAATALIAATIAIGQWDIKKVLAYSTISQLGYMFMACGVGAFTAGIFHVFTHSFFKALLFLGSGSVIIGMHHVQEMQKMGGLKRYMPWTFRTMAVGWLAIAGVPLLSGFFSKDEILSRSFTTSILPEPWPKLLWLVGALTALLTAIYMTRLIVLTFWGEERFNGQREAAAASKDGHARHAGPPRESPMTMVLPLVVLAVGAITVGYLGVPESLSGGKVGNWFENFLKPVLGQSEAIARSSFLMDDMNEIARRASEEHSTEIELAVISSLIALAGLAIGWYWFRRNALWQPPRLLERKYYVDEVYDAAIVQPVKAGSTSLLWKVIDVGLIDGLLVDGSAWAASKLGATMRYLQSGFARAYVAMVVLGALIIIGYFVIYVSR